MQMMETWYREHISLSFLKAMESLPYAISRNRTGGNTALFLKLSPRAPPEALPYPILQRMSSTSQSRSKPCSTAPCCTVEAAMERVLLTYAQMFTYTVVHCMPLTCLYDADLLSE